MPDFLKLFPPDVDESFEMDPDSNNEKEKESTEGAATAETPAPAGGSAPAEAPQPVPSRGSGGAIFRFALVVMIFAAAGVTLVWFLRPGLFAGKPTEHARADAEKSGALRRSPASRHGPPKGVIAGMAEAFQSIQAKADVLREAHESNRRLELENANLRLWVEQLRYECSESKAGSATREIASHLEKTAGAAYARVLSGIRYSPPAHLLPPQMYTLGVSYLKAGEVEKAAVIFHFLTHMAENSAYRTPKNLLLSGVAWYRLDHYRLADDTFGKVLELEAEGSDLQYQAQARLWRALVADKLNKRIQSQYWMKELVDHHPHSREAEWVNSGGARRVPGSHTEAKSKRHEAR